MSAPPEIDPVRFFATRAGVCAYVTLKRRVFRVRFASPDAHGVVVDGHADSGAEEALEVARAAVQKAGARLAPLFEKVARGTT